MAENDSFERRSREVAQDEVDRQLQHYATKEFVSEELRKTETTLIRWFIGMALTFASVAMGVGFLVIRLID